MGKSIDSQVSFSGGEWSPQMDSRVDHPKYKHSCRLLHNMIPLKNGGATRRPGLRFIGQPLTPVREIAFQFSPTTSFVLAFSDHFITFYSNKQPVTLSVAPAWVSGGSYVVNDYVSVSSIIWRCILATSGTTSPGSDPTHWAFDNVLRITSPYSSTNYTTSIYESDVWTITPCQINDVTYLVSSRFPPYVLTRVTDTYWTIAPVNFNVPALLDRNSTDITLSASAVSGAGVTVTALAPDWVAGKYYHEGDMFVEPSTPGPIYKALVNYTSLSTFALDVLPVGRYGVYVGQYNVFQAGHVGSTWQMAYLKDATYIDQVLTGNGTSSTLNVLGAYEVHTFGVWSADILIQRSINNGTSWETIRILTGRSDNNPTFPGTAIQQALYRMVVQNWSAPVPSAGATTPHVTLTSVDSIVKGLFTITAYVSTVQVTATIITQLDSTTATKYWSEGAWSAVRGYPQAITTYQQRVIYGASAYEPQRIWGTRTNDIENFDRGDSTLATDSFAFDLAAVSRGAIQWLISQSDLFAGFSGAEWIINSGSSQGSAITTQAINAVELSSWGSAPGVQPYIVGNAIFYTQRQARSIQQMLFSIYTNKYMSSDMTTLSEHLFTYGIAQISYQPRFKNQGLVWIVTRDGMLLSMTYNLEQEVFGWARHTTGDDQGDKFESVCVIQGAGIEDDQVWCVVNRGIAGRTIELIDPINWEASTFRDAYYVDCGCDAVLSGAPGSTIWNLSSPLGGRYHVGTINGNITLPLSNLAYLDLPSSVAQYGDTVRVGLPINYELQPMRLDTDPRVGNTMALEKAPSDIYLRLLNSLGGNVSDGVSDVPIEYRDNLVPLGQGPQPFTGQKRIQPFSTYADDPVYIIRGSDALPLTVLAIVVKYDLAGKP
jgi:hypothetical protein